MAELELDPTKRGWRLTIKAPDIEGTIETGSLEGMAQILAAYGKFRVAIPTPNDGENAP